MTTKGKTPQELNLTKTMDPADYVLLGEQLKTVDERFKFASEQHPARRWEYGMCLRAILAWSVAHGPRGLSTVADVGGAGSPLFRMLMDQDLAVRVVDPKHPNDEKGHGPSTVEAYALEHGRQHPIVTCISVIEHIADEHIENFLNALALITAPGGLLFMTMDYWGKDSDEKDTAKFHETRVRIYNHKTWQQLAHEMSHRGFKLFGMPDWSYHGDHAEDSHSHATLSFQKETK